MKSTCLFCRLPAERILAEDGPCLAFRDGFPVSEGHTLIIPHRHVASFRDLTPDEWAAAHRLAQTIAANLQAADASITGFNFGANDGVTAGQSIFHCHLHLIPRRAGDHPAPRGGIRGVIPGRADYPCPHQPPPRPPPPISMKKT
ncbi:MAG: HIT family protein [Kiritimatiellia bacterium]|jgi:diadenosine tetraphosphate (Ap4A) HIT family hydrolase|nr:HIT family protein [Kiritimatiellia bacterium]